MNSNRKFNVLKDKDIIIDYNNNKYLIDIEYLLSPDMYIDYYDIFKNKIFGEKGTFTYILDDSVVDIEVEFHDNYDIYVLDVYHRYNIKKMLP